jgi:hypothetical protein
LSRELPYSTEDTGVIGITLLEVSLVLFAVVAAVLHLSLLAVAWTIPLKERFVLGLRWQAIMIALESVASYSHLL